MTRGERSALLTIDLEDLGFAEGGYLLVGHALAESEAVEVRGRDPYLPIHVAAWARGESHRADGLVVCRGSSDRWRDATRADPSAPIDHPLASWGLSARGALVETGGPSPVGFDLDSRDVVWSELAPKLYAQAAASQWDPAVAVDWSSEVALTDDVEAAVVQVMTYLIENEQAALQVPARFLGRIHPHFREVIQLLAVQVADEARHVEVFTRRAVLKGGPLGTSSAGGRASLQTLFEEPDFSLTAFLLSVLGEGSFLNLLAFLEEHAPDPVTRQVAHLALQDESRHVAFGMSHLQHVLSIDPGVRERLRAAVQRRHAALSTTAGLNRDVFDALVILAAGRWTPTAIGAGWARVQELQARMDQGRQHRLVRLGFSSSEAAELSDLHTRNFM